MGWTKERKQQTVIRLVVTTTFAIVAIGVVLALAVIYYFEGGLYRDGQTEMSAPAAGRNDG